MCDGWPQKVGTATDEAGDNPIFANHGEPQGDVSDIKRNKADSGRHPNRLCLYISRKKGGLSSLACHNKP
jgi:hypothetical protein